ncbi:MAG: OmpA family protein [Treponema sp.]|nr:OmpA family protein [Treponema sp.]
MKRLLILLLYIFTGAFLFAQEDSVPPRYQGFAFGGGLFTQFPLGDYSDFAAMNLGASLAGEYTLPLELGNNVDLGLALRAEFGHVFTKSGTPLKADEELRAFAAFWNRIPFMLGNQFFAFQPEVGAGVSTFFSKYEVSGKEKKATYISPLVSTALSFRWIPQSLQKLEIEAAPLFTLVPEKDKATMMLGLRLGAVWHFQMKNDSSAEEKKQLKLAEAERARLEKEEKERLDREEEEKRRRQAELAEQKRLEEEARLAEEEKQREEEAARLAKEKAEPTLVTERLKLKHILYFSKNGAVFTGLSRKQIRQNEKTIDEAVVLIKQHPECTVYIEGYAQNISGTEKENQTACMPLSLWRAEYVKKELIKRGIAKDKIETVGMGGANPIANPDDRSSWWKNRRVEFVITYMSEVEDEQ